MPLRLLACAAMVALCAPLTAPTAATAAGSHEQIQGAGSSWAANAIQQWISDVTQRGLQVVYTPSGSATGRTDYAQGVTDFAVSDIGYQGVDPQTGQDDVSNRAYAYLPVVGGGTAFPYHITVAGQLVRNLRLSQQTLAMIFTDQITNWNDPRITQDNDGRQLPSIPIVPVVHSEGAGTTFQITDWLNSRFPALWKAFSGYSFPVEYWPSGKGSQVSPNGSDGVMNFISSGAGQGSIGFDEYSYALAENYPVAKVENTAGYFTAPDQYNVAVALTQAQINYTKGPDYLLENLDKVWVYSDPRTYPLSSYSYLIEPTGQSDPTMDTGKRQTLVDYMTYSLCPGQAEMGPIGYSPLPINLVEASFQQLGLQKQVDPNVSLSSVNVTQCNNPTFDPSNPSLNRLAQIAPYPPSCDKAGQGPCGDTVGIYLGNPTGTGANARPTTGPTGGSSSGGGSSSTGGSGSGKSATGASGAGGATGGGSTAAGTGAGSSRTSGGSASAGTGGSNGSGNNTSGATGSTTTTTVTPNLVVTTLAAIAAGTWWEYLAAVALIVLLAAPILLPRTAFYRRLREGGRPPE